MKPVRSQAQNILAPPAISSVGVDLDNDGNFDQWNITMKIKKPQSDYKLEQANVILGFDYRTDDIVNMQMESLAVAQVYVPAQSMSVSASKIRLSGTLRFKQTEPIYQGIGSGQRNEYNDDFFDQLEYLGADQLMQEYVSQRNETTKFEFSKNV